MSAGRGPAECSWAVAELARRLEGEAVRAGVRVRRIESEPGDRPGTYRSVLLGLSGAGTAAVTQFVRSWTGTLCWQAPSPYRSGHGRKNWYVIAEPLAAPSTRREFTEDDVELVPCRTGGPGGQHRNKASTAVRARHRPTGIVVVVDTERQLSANRRLAVNLLRHKIEQADEAAERAVTASLWSTHDRLIRGDPTRIERPEPLVPSAPPTPRGGPA